MKAVAVAHPNIALAKYWGKRPEGHNLPAVPSLSVTLAGMTTRTEVIFDGGTEDRLHLDGAPVAGRAVARVGQLLDLVWDEARRSGVRPRAAVRSENDFPTAAGLASSASAFAALATAADAALATELSASRLSCLARRVSASAGRSLFGGFVILPAGTDGQAQLPAEPLAGPDHWNLRLVVAVTTEAKKEVGSTEGMQHTAATSPLYRAWLEGAPKLYERVREAVLARDLDALGSALEASALAMHATAMAADPGLLYWNDVTMRTLHAVRRSRANGGPAAFFTIDAGPHVKVLCAVSDVDAVRSMVGAIPGVTRVIVAAPGPGAHVVVDRPSTEAPSSGSRG
ncbi:MAG: diphosphomevalonate decarboxylase [Myxococcota bacterium]